MGMLVDKASPQPSYLLRLLWVRWWVGLWLRNLAVDTVGMLEGGICFYPPLDSSHYRGALLLASLLTMWQGLCCFGAVSAGMDL